MKKLMLLLVLLLSIVTAKAEVTPGPLSLIVTEGMGPEEAAVWEKYNKLTEEVYWKGIEHVKSWNDWDGYKFYASQAFDILSKSKLPKKEIGDLITLQKIATYNGLMLAQRHLKDEPILGEADKAILINTDRASRFEGFLLMKFGRR